MNVFKVIGAWLRMRRLKRKLAVAWRLPSPFVTLAGIREDARREHAALEQLEARFKARAA